MIYLALFVALSLPIAGLMAWQWYRRERDIQAAWRRLRSSLDLEASKLRIDGCVELLLTEYGSDTFGHPQLEDLSRDGVEGISSVHRYARLAADRWQVTLPELQLRVLSTGEVRMAGTFTDGGTEWAAVLGGTQEVNSSLIQERRAYEIQVASQYLSDHEALPVILAHEISHFVLLRDGVTTGNFGEDEVLTDVAAALVGYGNLMRRLRSRERRSFGPGTALTWSISGPGYLLPEELDYVLLRHEQITQQASAFRSSAGDVAPP